MPQKSFNLTQQTAKRVARVTRAFERQNFRFFNNGGLTQADRAHPIKAMWAVLLEDIDNNSHFNHLCIPMHKYSIGDVQVVTFYGTSVDGTVTLTFNFGAGAETTAAIDSDADQDTVLTAVKALASVGTNDVEVIVINGRWWFLFQENLAGELHNLVVINDTGLTDGDAVAERWFAAPIGMADRTVSNPMPFADPGAAVNQLYAGNVVFATTEGGLGMTIKTAECREYKQAP